MQSIRIAGWLEGTARLAALAAVLLIPASCWGITLGQIDNFNNTTSTMNWGIMADGSGPVENAQGEGVSMMSGDNALLVDTEALFVSRLVVVNILQWTGDWTSTGVGRISLDVRNPSAFPLFVRLGISGVELGPGSMGGGPDAYVTEAISVPDDDLWHSIIFDVLPSDWISVTGTDINTALADVKHFRILNNSSPSFTGAPIGGAMYLDNISALPVPEPGTVALAVMGFSILALWRRNDCMAERR